MITLLIDIAGWTGSALMIYSYWLVSTQKVSSYSTFYQLLNIVGSIMLLVNAFHYNALPSSTVNLIWAFIGLYWLGKIRSDQRRLQQKAQ